MKTIICQLLIITALFSIHPSVFAQKTVFNHTFNSEDFKLTRVDGYTTIESGNELYYYKSDPGKPALPYCPVHVAVPESAEYVRVAYNSRETLIATEVVIHPAQPMIPYGTTIKDQKKIKPDKAIYRSAKPFPEHAVNYTSTQQMNKYRFFTFDICPFVYFPDRHELYLIEEISVEVFYTEGASVSANHRFDNGTFYHMLSEEVVNPDELRFTASQTASSGCDFLIITNEELASSFQPLANWKTQKGIQTRIVTVEEIYEGYPGETEQLKIKHCLAGFFEDFGTLYVLLGGDNSVVPVQRCYSKGFGDPDNTIPTDLYYACFDHTFNWDANNNKIYGEITDYVDFAPELFVTRAPVQTQTHARAFVSKSLNYEKNPPSSGFANKMVNFGVQLFEKWGGRCDGAWLSDKMIADYIDPYWDGTHHRFYTFDSLGTSYNVNDSLVSSQLEEGHNFLFMASHGEPGYWLDSENRIMDMGNVFELSNAGREGLIVTIACLTNAFDDPIMLGTSYPAPIKYDSCLSEAFIRNAEGGAVAYHGCSRVGIGLCEPTSNLGPSFLYSANFFKSIFSGQPYPHKYSLGAVSTQTKIHFIGTSQNDGAYRWLQLALNTLGDPTLDILTDDPMPISMMCPDTIPLGNQEVFTIETGNPGVNICLNNHKDVYITGTTQSNGKFNGSLFTVNTDPVIVTASGHNCYYATDTIRIGRAQGAVVYISDYSVETHEGHYVDYCENVDVSVRVENCGVDTARNIQLNYSSGSDIIELNAAFSFVYSLPPGQDTLISGAIDFDVNCFIPDQSSFEVRVNIADRTGSHEQSLVFEALAPRLEIGHYGINHTDNFTAPATDSSSIQINLINTGSATARDIDLDLTSEYGGHYLEIYNFSDSVSSLGPLNDTVLNFNFYSDLELCMELPFVLEMNAFGYARADGMVVPLYDSIENFESGDFQHYPWKINTGDADWVIDSVNAYNGKYCARSGVIQANQHSILEVELEALADCILGFYRKTSYLTGNSNTLDFYIDSVLVSGCLGNADWAPEVFPVMAGVHTFQWVYNKKDITYGDTLDFAWIDYVMFPEVTIPETEITDINTNIGFKVYPNPGSGVFNLYVGEFNQDMIVEVVDLKGKSVYMSSHINTVDNNIMNINLTHLDKGIYLLRLYDRQKVSAGKIVII